MKKFCIKAHDLLNAIRQFRFQTAFLTGFFVVGIFIASAANNAYSQNSAVKSQAAQKSLTGEWVTDFNADTPAEIEITFVRPSLGVPNAIGITFSLSEFQTLKPEAINAAKTKVNFSLTREAGKFNWEGHFNRGRGTGLWTFTPDQNFAAAMRGLGYENLSDDDLLRAAWHNLTSKSVEKLKAAGYDSIEFRQFLRSRPKKNNQ